MGTQSFDFDNVDGVNYNGVALNEFRLNGTTLWKKPWSGITKKIEASDKANYDRFGASVAIGGGWAVVGAPYKGSYTGYVYIFSRSGSNWTQKQQIWATDYSTSDKFGTSVAIDGDYIVVGAPDADAGGYGAQGCGAAYIFKRNSNNVWTQHTKLVASDGQDNDEFGCSVAISGNYVIVGARGADQNMATGSGCAYVFELQVTSWPHSWGQKGILWASDATRYESPDYKANAFGNSVDINSTGEVVVGAHRKGGQTNAPGINGTGPYTGAVYIFKRNADGTWGIPTPYFSHHGWRDQNTKLTAIDGGDGDFFGISVAIEGDWLVVGASGDDSPTDAGGVYVYKRSGTTFSNYSFDKLEASNQTAEDFFGKAVAISGNQLIIGAPWANASPGGPEHGKVYLFKNLTGTAGNWDQVTEYGGSGEHDAEFGSAVAISGNYAIGGSRNEGSTDSGTAYIFS